MKKNMKIIPLLMVSLLIGLSGCSNDNGGGTTTSSITSEDGSTSRGEDEKNQTVKFYLDFSHSDEPIYTMKWWSITPLGECPEECRLTSADAADPMFPVFLGWSEYPSSVDDSHIWNFETDYKYGILLELYGIWVAND